MTPGGEDAAVNMKHFTFSDICKEQLLELTLGSISFLIKAQKTAKNNNGINEKRIKEKYKTKIYINGKVILRVL